MSIPSKKTTFGTLKYNGEIYKIFSIPIGEERAEKIRLFKNTHNYGSSTASWIFNIYEWEIDDNKLYLTNVDSFLAPNDKKYNILQEVFGVNKLFIDSKEIKIKALVKDIDEKMIEHSIKECIREVLRFNFKDGILQEVKNEIEVYRMKVLKNYVED